jgi:hypothetical protein
VFHAAPHDQRAIPKGTAKYGALKVSIGMWWQPVGASVRLDVSCPDYLAPFFGFVSDELCKIGRRA